jgi:hypothetical protein
VRCKVLEGRNIPEIPSHLLSRPKRELQLSAVYDPVIRGMHRPGPAQDAGHDLL